MELLGEWHLNFFPHNSFRLIMEIYMCIYSKLPDLWLVFKRIYGAVLCV
jgi:hypothetical protein